jgi:hypothetical protein
MDKIAITIFNGDYEPEKKRETLTLIYNTKSAVLLDEIIKTKDTTGFNIEKEINEYKNYKYNGIPKLVMNVTKTDFDNFTFAYEQQEKQKLREQLKTPHNCPYCNTYHTRQGSYDPCSNGQSIEIESFCNKCGKKWTLMYTISTIKTY